MTQYRLRGSCFATVAASAVLMTAVFATGASGFHIPGATYTGTHSYGGTVEFTVTPSGSGLSRFAATGTIPGSSCTFTGGSSTTYVTPLPIVNHAFNDTASTTRKSGSFGSVQSSSGQFQINAGGCSSPSVSWNATTTASPAESEECKSATAKVKRAERRLKQADTPSEKKKAKRKLKKARQEQRAVC
jgi:hypothetical protein